MVETNLYLEDTNNISMYHYFVIADEPNLDSYWEIGGRYQFGLDKKAHVYIDFFDDYEVPDIHLIYDSEDEMIEDLLRLTTTGRWYKVGDIH